MKREDIMLLLSHRKVQRLYCVICCCENGSAWPERSCTFIFANIRCLSNYLIYWFKKKMLTVLKHLILYISVKKYLFIFKFKYLNLNLEQTWAIIIVMLLLAINTKWKLWMQSIMLLSTLGFRRKEFRGKLAIAITANFVNRNTTAEAKVEEISGVAFIFNQKFFLELKEETGVVKLLHDRNKICIL